MKKLTQDEENAAHEVAVNAFEDWAEAMEIDIEGPDFTEEDVGQVVAFRRKFVRRVKRGTLTVAEDGTLTLAVANCAEPLVFAEPRGSAMSTRMKGDNDAKATRRLLAEWTGAPIRYFADMNARDLVFCNDLAGFFLAS